MVYSSIYIIKGAILSVEDVFKIYRYLAPDDQNLKEYERVVESETFYDYYTDLPDSINRHLRELKGNFFRVVHLS